MKKLILFIIGIFIFINTANAGFNTSMRAYWNFTKDGVDSIGGFDMTATNVVFIDGKADFEAGNSSKLERADQLLSQNFDGAATDNFTVCFSNITIESLIDGGGLWGENDGNLEAFILRTKNNGSAYKMNTWDTAIWCNTALSAGLTYSFCMTYDEILDDVYFYQSNSTSCGFNTGWDISISTVAKSNIGSYAGGGGNFDGTINEVCAWDRVINATEIDQFMTYGCVGPPPAAPLPPGTGPAPSFSLSTNLTTGINKTENPYRFNVSGNSFINITTDLFNCSLYMNDSLNITALNIKINNTPNIFNLTYGDEERAYNINITCSRIEQNVYTVASILRNNIFLDSVQPDLTYTGIDNNKIYWRNLTASAFYWNITIFDNNLLAYNITLFNTTNASILNIFNGSTYNDTFNNYTAINLDTYPLGLYKINIQAWDDHTAKEIPDYTVNIGHNYLLYNNVIRIEGDLSQIKTVDTKKKKDRYYWYFEFNNKDVWNYLTVTSDGPLIYLPNSNYPGHFVDLKNNKWLDFNSQQVTDYNVIKINDHTYRVEFYNIDKKVYFESIGDLNTINEWLNFTLADSSYIFAYDKATNLSISAFYLRLYNSSYSIVYNASGGFMATNLTGLFNATINATNFVNASFLNLNLTAGGTTSLYLNASNAFIVYIRDQLTSALIQPQTVYLEFIGTNSSNYSTTTGYKYITGLLPDDYIIRYSSANYTDAFYYFTLENGTNTQFTIYMLTNTSSDAVTATVIDELNNELEGAYIHVQRYNLLTNSYITVEIVKTNFEGDAVIHVTQGTEFYKFLIYYEDALKKTTSPTYIYEDTITFQINLFTTVMDDFYTTEGINWDLTFNTATHNFNFQYSDGTNTVTKGELYLYNVSAGYQDLYNYTSASAASGTLLLNAPNVSGRTYRADGVVIIDGEKIFLGSLYYYYPATEPPSTSKNANLFYILLLSLLFITLGFWNLSIAVLLAPLPLLFGSITGMIPLPVYTTAPIMVMALILVYILNKNG